MIPPVPRQTFRFGRFELDMLGYALRRDGRAVRLERQPMDLLILLVTRRGELVSRAEITAKLWSKDVFVDVETGVNTAVRKIRRALNDSPEQPSFIETIAGKGYRFVGDVQVVRAGLAGTSIVTLAVLPFINLSGDPQREHLADGLTDDTIAALSQLDPEHLRVIGRTSAMAYKATQKSIATIANELAAQFVLEGSVRSEGVSLRIRCTLIRAQDQVQLWSQTYDRQLTSLLDVQRELSIAIADQIRLELSPERMEAVARRHTRNEAGYDFYLRGRRFWHQLTPASTRMAVEYYSRATEMDSNYALAWAGLAEAFAGAPINGDAEPLVMWPRALAAAEQAVRANPELSEAQHVFGQVLWFFAWDFDAADRAFQKAVALDPNNAWAHSMYGHALSQSGRHEKARKIMDHACLLEPLSPLHQAMASQVAFQGRDMVRAAERARRAIVIDSEFWVGHMMSGQAYEHLGEADLALDALGTAARLSGGNSKPVSLRAYVLARTGQPDVAREVLSMLEEVARTRYVPPYAMALIAAGLQDDEATFDWLERAYAARDVHLVFLPVDPKWDRLRADVRFRALIERCGFDDSRNDHASV
jgi:TolB-like protein/cytochrome c-type biogenesis protein CcmH/NrfG